MFVSATVLREPDDVTVCEGGSISLTCVLNGSMTSDEVQWYRLLKNTSTIERVRRQEDMIFFPIPNENSFITYTILNTINVNRSDTGYYWVKLPSDFVCLTPFIVTTSM